MWQGPEGPEADLAMSADEHPDVSDALRAEAADWFVRVQSDAAGETDWLALEAWLAAAPAHRAAFDEVERLWSELDDHADALKRDPSPPPASNVTPFAPAQSRARQPRRWPTPWAIAASFAAVVAIGALGALWVLGARPKPEVFATAKGETRMIQLADGSRVELNSASRIVARVDRRHRNVELDEGEAVFDVQKDHAHPFRVAVGDQRVTVVGTEFDVLRWNGRITVTVSRGIVEIRPERQTGPAQQVRLVAGEQLRHREGAVGSTVVKAPARDALAWRNGYAVYRGQTLAAIAEDLNRYFDIPIDVDGPAARLTFTGALVIDNEDAVIARLESFLPVEAVRSPGRITLRSR